MISSNFSGIALTDDEMLAACLRLDADWPSPLPTLVGTEEDERLAALSRGWRALAVRELVEDGHPAPSVSGVIEMVARSRILVRTFLAGDDGSVPTLGTFMTAYERSDPPALLVEVTSGTGIHRFDLSDAPRVMRVVEDTVRDVWQHGVEVPAEWPANTPCPTNLCASSAASGDDLMLIVSRGRFQVVHVDQSGTTTAVPVGGDLESALTRVLTPARAGAPTTSESANHV